MLWAVAAASFGKYCRPGMVNAAGPVQTIGRAVFILVVVLAFLRTGCPGGVAACLGGGLAGLLLPALGTRALIKPTPTLSPPPVSPVPNTRLKPVLPAMGRPAILRDMVQNGISKAKVWRLIYHGKLLAFEDPQSGKITLLRPQDLEAMDLDPMNLEK